MAFKKTLVQRLFNLSRFSTPSLSRKPPLIQPDPAHGTLSPGPRETGQSKRNLQRRPLYHSAMSPASECRRKFPPPGENLLEKLRGMDIARTRIRLDGLVVPFPEKNPTVSDVRKIMRATQVEMIMSKLREIPRDWISFTEFVEICSQSCGGNRELGLGFAKTLDDSGSVIVLSNAVCLRPHQVAKAIQNLFSSSMSDPNDPRRKELKQMEERKEEIDQKAEALVRRELWAGLGFLVAQTAAFMRLTFWELSWDVMEPICFYVTSVYFMAGYAFFLRTSKEPSFEGFFQSRFSAKQKLLIKTHDFDLDRFNELKRAFYPHFSSSSSTSNGHHESS